MTIRSLAFISSITKCSTIGSSTLTTILFSVITKQIDTKIVCMNLIDVYESVKNAVQLTRDHSKPSLLEIRTYRYLGHSMSDPATYRTKEEVAKYKSQDPIIILKDRMILADMLAEQEYAAIAKDCKSIVSEAVDFAEKSDQPEIKTLYEDVLAE